MKKIIERGYITYRTRCTNCDCYFSYDICDVDNHNQVACPECNAPCYHSTINKDLTSQVEDDK